MTCDDFRLHQSIKFFIYTCNNINYTLKNLLPQILEFLPPHIIIGKLFIHVRAYMYMHSSDERERERERVREPAYASHIYLLN